MSKAPVIAVLGPTASGKTSLAAAIAERFSGEVVSCDSMQIYAGLPIATAQPSEAEKRGVRHHLIGFLSPETPFSVAEYVSIAGEAVRDLTDRGKLPILCGGTGLYADALLGGMSFADTDGAEEKRAELTLFIAENGLDAAVERLLKADPDAFLSVDLKNPKRVLRALEIVETTARPLAEYRSGNICKDPPYRALRLVIDFRDRQKLYLRINSRVDLMLENGLVDEAKRYFSLACPATSSQAIGYKELKPWLDGEKTFAEAAEELKRATRRYAKRQQTWFRRSTEAVRLYADEEDIYEKAFGLCEKFLKGAADLA